MAKLVLSAPRFRNEEAAFAYVEAHLWPDGPVCPHCGNIDQARIGRLQGKSSRPGLRKCYACRKTFTVRIGSIFEDSHFRCIFGCRQFTLSAIARMRSAPGKFSEHSIAA